MCRNRAFTLIELALVVVVSALLAGAVVPNYVRSLQIEASKKTALEMSQLAEAARAYYIEEGCWPDGIDVLRTAGFVDSSWSGQNPFGQPYLAAASGGTLTLTTTVLQPMAPVVAASLPMAHVQAADVIMTVTPPGAAMASVPTGTMMPWPSQDIPDGWLVCDGRAVSRTDEAALFAVIGVHYGSGNGTDTFNLPDLRGRTVIGMDDMGAGAANVITDVRARTPGGVLGEEKHQLTVAEMPSHTHAYYATFLSGRYDGHSSLVATNPLWSDTSSAGGDQAHNNIQPSIALMWIIKA